MTLTRTQMHERAGSLSGEIKAAREAQSECRRALEDQERLVTIAVQAVVRADARVEELLAERAELAQDMAQAILQVGEAPVADEAAPAVEVEPMTPETVFVNGIGGNLVCTVCGGYDQHKPECAAGHIKPPEAWVDHSGLARRPGGFPNAIFNGVDRAYDEATQP